MDPITLAVITSAITTLAAEAAKSVASEAGKDLWTKVKSLLGWSKEPALDIVALEAAKRLNADNALAKQVLVLLQQQPSMAASAIVKNINAQNVTVAERIVVKGNFQVGNSAPGR
ncbi:MAG TPA: hypothetical protein VGQ99_08250 [Tepidisphaeraceae bacterium]|nr:hypothetical protein [Tepidisphaeraceae bacterium]